MFDTNARNTPTASLTGLVAPYALLIALAGVSFALAGYVASDLTWSVGLMVTGGAFVLISAISTAGRQRQKAHDHTRTGAPL